MAQFLAVLLLAVLIAAGWNRPFKSYLEAARAKTPELAMPTPLPKRDRSWMFKPNVMDAPYNSTSKRSDQ